MNRSQRSFALLLTVALGVTACAAPAPSAPAIATQAPVAAKARDDLNGVKTYLVDKSEDLTEALTGLQATSDAYYALAKAANFDYQTLWNTQQDAVIETVTQARDAWKVASPLYEQMEGIVAGTPSLVEFDVNMDAGVSAADGGEGVVTFDLTLPDGRTLAKPGNLFGLTEGALWGSSPDYAVQNVSADFDGDGGIEFGDALPDANALKGGVDELAAHGRRLLAAAEAWQPTEAEAFGALVQNVPTVGDFVDSWRGSRFVAGNAGSSDFGAISRLSDIVDNITSWQTIYRGLSPAVVAVDSDGDAAIHQGLDSLKSYISGIFATEQGGKQYTPEDADLIRKEAQDRATAITGQISQAAARLDIQVTE